MDKNKKIAAGIGIILLLVLCSGGSYLLVSRNLADEMRDFLLILLAVQSLVIGAFLLLTLWQIYRLVQLLREEVIPLLTTTKETVDQVKTTTTFVGQSVAGPIITLRGVVSGVKAMGDNLRNKREPVDYLKRK